MGWCNGVIINTQKVFWEIIEITFWIFGQRFLIFGIFVLPKLIPIFFPKFIDTVDAIGIMTLAVVPEAITMLYISKMLGHEKSKFILIAKLVSLITVIVGFIILGPIFGTVPQVPLQ